MPIGAFLSGGVDSSAVVGLMRAYSPHAVRTFTVGFDYPEGSDGNRKFNVDVRYAADQTLSRYLALPRLLRRGVLDSIFARIPVERLNTLARKAGRTTPDARYLEWLRRVDHARAHEMLRALPDTADPMPCDEAVRQVRATLDAAVDRQMMSDVPIGAFLDQTLAPESFAWREAMG